MNTVFPIILIVISVFSLVFPTLFYIISIRKMDASIKQFTDSLLRQKRNELIFGSGAYVFILIGAIGLLKNTHWANTVTLIGLCALLLYVWVENVYKLVYFQKLNKANNEPMRQELESKVEEIIEPLGEEVNDAVDFDDDFYQLAEKKNKQKAIGRIIVGSLMIVPAILYLL